MLTRIARHMKSYKRSKGIRDGLKPYWVKAQQIQPINPNQFFIIKTKGTFQSQRSFGLSYKCCCTSSAALICHQARAVTTELLLHHRLFCHQNQQAGVATLWNLHTSAATSHFGTWHRSGPTAHAVKPPLICYHDKHKGWPQLLCNSTGRMTGAESLSVY